MPGLFHGTSLEQSVTCERCGLAIDACSCPRGVDGRAVLPSDQQPRVRREKRRGKWSTVVAELDPAATDFKAVLKDLRTMLGTGGGLSATKSPMGPATDIVLQGDHRDAVVAHLVSQGYRAKAAGG